MATGAMVEPFDLDDLGPPLVAPALCAEVGGSTQGERPPLQEGRDNDALSAGGFLDVQRPGGASEAEQIDLPGEELRLVAIRDGNRPLCEGGEVGEPSCGQSGSTTLGRSSCSWSCFESASQRLCAVGAHPRHQGEPPEEDVAPEHAPLAYESAPPPLCDEGQSRQ